MHREVQVCHVTHAAGCLRTCHVGSGLVLVKTPVTEVEDGNRKCCFILLWRHRLVPNPNLRVPTGSEPEPRWRTAGSVAVKA